MNLPNLVAAAQQRADGDDPLELLAAAVAVAAEAGTAADALIEHYVGAARAAGVSWTLIGERLGVSKQAARQKFANRLQVDDQIADAAENLAIVPRLQACLQVAHTAADADDSAAGTHHLLLGLLHGGVSAGVLDRLGVTRGTVREAAARLLEPAMITTGDGTERRVVGDGEAEQAIAAARRLAARRGHTQLRCEHLLFSLATDPGSAARRVLDDLGTDISQLTRDLQEWVAPVQRRHRRIGKSKSTGRACSFCGCTDLGPLVAGPGVWICGNCAQTAIDILRAELRGARTG
ncbi:Clp protease N-terminal domain-containing protein [Spirillospora sp. NPDC000708]